MIEKINYFYSATIQDGDRNFQVMATADGVLRPDEPIGSGNFMAVRAWLSESIKNDYIKSNLWRDSYKVHIVALNRI